MWRPRTKPEDLEANPYGLSAVLARARQTTDPAPEPEQFAAHDAPEPADLLRDIVADVDVRHPALRDIAAGTKYDAAADRQYAAGVVWMLDRLLFIAEHGMDALGPIPAPAPTARALVSPPTVPPPPAPFTSDTRTKSGFDELYGPYLRGTSHPHTGGDDAGI